MKRCNYCTRTASYRIKRGKVLLFACFNPAHRDALDREARERFGALRCEALVHPQGFITRTGRASPRKYVRKPVHPNKARAVRARKRAERQRFMCLDRHGDRIPAVRLWPFSNPLGPVRVRRVKRPKQANVTGKILVLYDHGGDRYDAQASVVVGKFMWDWQKCSGARRTTALRRGCERGLGVRPRLDDLKHAEQEVADLLRKKAACAELARETTIINDPPS